MSYNEPRFHPVSLIIVICMGLIVGTSLGMLHNNSEITTFAYQDVQLLTEQYPSITPIVKEKLEDDIITKKEYKDIQREAQRARIKQITDGIK